MRENVGTRFLQDSDLLEQIAENTEGSGGSGGGTVDQGASGEEAWLVAAPTLLSAIQAVQTAVAAVQSAVAALPQNNVLGASNANIGDVDVLTLPSISAGEAHVGAVGGHGAIRAATLTRPADTTAYAAKDAISNSTSAPTYLTFANLARVSGGSGYIVKAQLMTNQSTNVAQYRLHLFNTAPTAINDNSPYTLLWANRASRVGYIDFGAAATEGSGSDAANSQNDTARLHFVTSGSASLFGILETLSAFTPASDQVFYIALSAEQD